MERSVTIKWAASLGQAHWPSDMLNKFVLRVKCIHARQITQKHDVTRIVNNKQSKIYRWLSLSF